MVCVALCAVFFFRVVCYFVCCILLLYNRHRVRPISLIK
jgi:hypothetical protein